MRTIKTYILLAALCSVYTLHGDNIFRTATETFVTNQVIAISNRMEEAISGIANEVTEVSNRMEAAVYDVRTNLTDIVTNAVSKKTVAMFIIPVNDVMDYYNWYRYCKVELKCSTNNYATTEFYTSTGYLDDYAGDGSDVLQLNWPDYSDKRKYRNISNLSQYDLGAAIESQSSIVIFVQPSKCRRTNGKWMYEGNESMSWIWVRSTWDGREENYDYSSGTSDGTGMWRPIAPVKWFSKMPDWAVNP